MSAAKSAQRFFALRDRRPRMLAVQVATCESCLRRPPLPNAKQCASCRAEIRRRNHKPDMRSQRPIAYPPFCLECIASGGYHRVDCPLRKEAA